ncbi:MAG: hypothetical protein Q8905_11235, partial [Bacteroidota bacterium]|nr:hypothetical protein [Bacteroidota bacterium]
EDAVFEEDKILFNKGNYNLSFQERHVLREGPLTKVLSNIFFLEIMLKSCIFSIYERKLKAKAILNCGGDKSFNGWALYETVTWGNGKNWQ